MKSFLPTLALVACMSTPLLADDKLDLKNETAVHGYSQGYLIGQRFKAKLQSDKTDLGAFAQGMKDALVGKPQLTNEQLAASMKKGPVHLRAAKEKKKMENEKFLAENKVKTGVTTTASGLQYSVVASGAADGKNPTAADTVIVHYTGTLISGKKFDSSRDRGSPATFGVGQVIPGWTEVLKLMKPGDRWNVVIPSNLGYGARGAGGVIGPNEVLLFDVELIGIK